MTVGLGLEGRCGLVTGGTSDIGAACVRRLCHEGMTIAFTAGAHDHDIGEAITQRTGATSIECDHRDRESTDHAVERALELTGSGRLDVLVTNVDQRLPGSIEATSEVQFRELVEVNLTAVFRVARACWQPMRAAGGGSMILIASDAGIRADHELAACSVTSAGVIAVAELFGAEGRAYGIRANAVCPGGVDGDQPSSARSGTAADVASLVAWLAGDESAHISGATLRIDGGAGAAMVLDTRG